MTKEEIIKDIKDHLEETYNIGFHEDEWIIILKALEQEPICPSYGIDCEYCPAYKSCAMEK